MVKTGLVEAIDSLVPLDEHFATFRGNGYSRKGTKRKPKTNKSKHGMERTKSKIIEFSFCGRLNPELWPKQWTGVGKLELEFTSLFKLREQDPILKLNLLGKKKRKNVDDLHDYFMSTKRYKTSVQFANHQAGTVLNEPSLGIILFNYSQRQDFISVEGFEDFNNEMLYNVQEPLRLQQGPGISDLARTFSTFLVVEFSLVENAKLNDVDLLSKAKMKCFTSRRFTSLLEQRKESSGNGEYDYDPYDDDMYEGQDIPDMIQDIYDNFDIKVHGRKLNGAKLERGPRKFGISSWRGSRVDGRSYLLSGVIASSEANRIIRDSKLELENSHVTFDLVPLSYESVNVVVGENWLLRHKAEMVNQCTSDFHRVNEQGGVRVTREDDRGVTEGRKDVREVFQQRGSGERGIYLEEEGIKWHAWKREKVVACTSRQLKVLMKDCMANMLDKVRTSIWRDVWTLAIEEAYTAKYSIHPRADTMFCGFRLTNRWLSMKKDIASCGSKYLVYSKMKVEYQGPSGLLLQPELPE
ncbi:hypothetical protein Tco_0390318 [Tanacetum coccineum]